MSAPALLPGITDDFQIPAPYRLSGPKPDPDHRDVKLIHDVCARRFLGVEYYPGLVMQCGQVNIQYYVTLCIVEDEHRFYEASGHGKVFRSWELPEFLAELEQAPYLARRPGEPARPGMLP